QGNHSSVSADELTTSLVQQLHRLSTAVAGSVMGGLRARLMTTAPAGPVENERGCRRCAQDEGRQQMLDFGDG
ncbi:MAG: hypothetical protein Q8P40_05800, partial [Nitrospirota bacterium]|nr:hypothetical protein [Nitrospirota bacterium]